IIKPIAARSEKLHRQPVRRRSMALAELAMVTDLDLNLIGDDVALQKLVAVLKAHRKSTKFVIATGRRLDQALILMRRHAIPEPDVLITSSGSEIYHAPKLTPDTAWIQHIDRHWTPHKLRHIHGELPGLKLQPKEHQSRFKL